MFSLKDILRLGLQKTAAYAKERLQIIIAHERSLPCRTIDLPSLQTDLLNIVRKYIVIKDEDITIRLEKKGRYEILELNIILPNMENQQFD
ncbi:MAG: cell division topological specificity factor MinE [Pseudomonadota bacterium]